jgi:hypothetical protein
LTAGGSPLSDEAFSLEFRVAAAGSGSLAGNPPSGRTTMQRSAEWETDDMIIAWGEADSFDNTNPDELQDYETMMINGVVNFLGSLFADYPYELSPGNDVLCCVFKLEPETKADLLGYLGDSQFRNFHWNGHGGPNNIGYSFRDPDTRDRLPTGVRIYENEIRLATGNRRGRIPHPYRFVFLHSCCGTAGRLSEAFGIESRALSVQHYIIRGMQPRAFIGASEVIGYPTYDEFYSRMTETLAIFYDNWVNDLQRLDVNLSIAQSWDPDNSSQPYPLAPEFRIYGARNLSRND